MMLKWSAAFAVLATAGLAQSDGWERVLSDEGITEALAGRTVVYDEYTLQHFGTAGDTVFVTERAANGRWAARAGQYCSVWPPSDVWTCYDFQVNGQRVRFISSDRSISEGSYQD